MVYKKIQVVYIVEQWKRLFGFELYPYSQVVCSTYDVACRELSFVEQKLLSKKWKRVGVREQIRHTDPIDAEVEYCYEKFRFFRQRIRLSTWCVLY